VTLQCIGKSRDSHGVVTQCGHTSDTPNDSRWPDIFLCQSCSGAAPNRLSRPQYKVEVEDVDPPNFDDYREAYEEAEQVIEQSVQEELDTLQELDLI
jgi:hypothetical protein